MYDLLLDTANCPGDIISMIIQTLSMRLKITEPEVGRLKYA